MYDLLFDQVPDDLIHLRISYLDCKEIFLFHNLSPQFERIFGSIIELIKK